MHISRLYFYSIDPEWMRRCAYDEVCHDLHAFGLPPCKSMPSLATTLKERPFVLPGSTVELPKLHSHTLHLRDATC